MKQKRIVSGGLGRSGMLLSLALVASLAGCLGTPPRREVIAREGESSDQVTAPAERPGGLVGSLLRLVASLVPRIHVSVPILEATEGP